MTERRTDAEIRALVERLEVKFSSLLEASAARGAELALQKFGELTPFDMATKEGRDKMRATVAHANFLMEGCESIKSDGMQMARRGALTLIGLSLLIGFVWLFGVNPDRVFKIFGGR